jgi:hypothetical protein
VGGILWRSTPAIWWNAQQKEEVTMYKKDAFKRHILTNMMYGEVMEDWYKIRPAAKAAHEGIELHGLYYNKKARRR